MGCSQSSEEAQPVARAPALGSSTPRRSHESRRTTRSGKSHEAPRRSDEPIELQALRVADRLYDPDCDKNSPFMKADRNFRQPDGVLQRDLRQTDQRPLIELYRKPTADHYVRTYLEALLYDPSRSAPGLQLAIRAIDNDPYTQGLYKTVFKQLQPDWLWSQFFGPNAVSTLVLCEDKRSRTSHTCLAIMTLIAADAICACSVGTNRDSSGRDAIVVSWDCATEQGCTVDFMIRNLFGQLLVRADQRIVPKRQPKTHDELLSMFARALTKCLAVVPVVCVIANVQEYTSDPELMKAFTRVLTAFAKNTKGGKSHDFRVMFVQASEHVVYESSRWYAVKVPWEVIEKAGHEARLRTIGSGKSPFGMIHNPVSPPAIPRV